MDDAVLYVWAAGSLHKEVGLQVACNQMLRFRAWNAFYAVNRNISLRDSAAEYEVGRRDSPALRSSPPCRGGSGGCGRGEG